jgi:enhancing lycopene biosynthesis protein 2
MSKKVGVLLSGCGFLDGAEIRESVLTLLALDQEGVEVIIMAPNQKQHHVINHAQSDEAKGQERNIFEEAARIARGSLLELDKVKASDLDALIIPGGYGVAKNLCQFAFKGHQGNVHQDVKKLLQNLHKAHKPIGALCIAPALIGLTLGEHKVEVTIGRDPEMAQEIEKTGAKHILKEVNDIHVDEKNKIVSTPAYMYGDARLSLINEGIKKCVDKVLELA